MRGWNIWRDVAGSLELHEDPRGRIVDIFYNTTINHVAVIDSKPGALRGDHYHKLATQHMLMTKGGLEYWYRPLESSEAPQCVVTREGDVITTPPYEVDALRILPEGNQFIVFSEGVRGGKDYESDTFRTQPSLIPHGKGESIEE
jgi:hypothetical protein